MTVYGFQFSNAGKFISRGRGRHPDRVIASWELIIVLSGTLEMFEEGKQFHLRPGDRLLLRAGRRHGGLAPYAPDLSFFWAHFLPQGPEEEALLRKMPSCAALPDPAECSAILTLILAEQQRKLRQEDSPAKENLNDLFRILLREAGYALPRAAGTVIPDAVSRTEEFLRLHFDESISTSDIARKLECHPDYLERLFRKARGLTIGEALRKIRTARAAQLLMNSVKPVKQIAYDSGYNDVSYFRRCFFREYALPPGKFRKRHAAPHVNTD